jgi:hypothetical protein
MKNFNNSLREYKLNEVDIEAISINLLKNFNVLKLDANETLSKIGENSQIIFFVIKGNLSKNTLYKKFENSFAEFFNKMENFFHLRDYSIMQYCFAKNKELNFCDYMQIKSFQLKKLLRKAIKYEREFTNYLMEKYKKNNNKNKNINNLYSYLKKNSNINLKLSQKFSDLEISLNISSYPEFQNKEIDLEIYKYKLEQNIPRFLSKFTTINFEKENRKFYFFYILKLIFFFYTNNIKHILTEQSFEYTNKIIEDKLQNDFYDNFDINVETIKIEQVKELNLKINLIKTLKPIKYEKMLYDRVIKLIKIDKTNYEIFEYKTISTFKVGDYHYESIIYSEHLNNNIKNDINNFDINYKADENSLIAYLDMKIYNKFITEEKNVLIKADIKYFTQLLIFSEIKNSYIKNLYKDNCNLVLYEKEMENNKIHKNQKKLLFSQNERMDKIFILKKGVLEITIKSSLFDLIKLAEDIVLYSIQKEYFNDIEKIKFEKMFKFNLEDIPYDISEKMNEIKEYKLFNLVENQIFAIEFFLLKMKSFYNIKLSSDTAYIYAIKNEIFEQNIFLAYTKSKEIFNEYALNRSNNFLNKINSLLKDFFKSNFPDALAPFVKKPVNNNLNKNLDFKRRDKSNIKGFNTVIMKNVLNINKRKSFTTNKLLNVDLGNNNDYNNNNKNDDYDYDNKDLNNNNINITSEKNDDFNSKFDRKKKKFNTTIVNQSIIKSDLFKEISIKRNKNDELEDNLSNNKSNKRILQCLNYPSQGPISLASHPEVYNNNNDFNLNNTKNNFFSFTKKKKENEKENDFDKLSIIKQNNRNKIFENFCIDERTLSEYYTEESNSNSMNRSRSISKSKSKKTRSRSKDENNNNSSDLTSSDKNESNINNNEKMDYFTLKYLGKIDKKRKNSFVLSESSEHDYESDNINDNDCNIIDNKVNNLEKKDRKLNKISTIEFDNDNDNNNKIVKNNNPNSFSSKDSSNFSGNFNKGINQKITIFDNNTNINSNISDLKNFGNKLNLSKKNFNLKNKSTNDDSITTRNIQNKNQNFNLNEYEYINKDNNTTRNNEKSIKSEFNYEKNYMRSSKSNNNDKENKKYNDSRYNSNYKNNDFYFNKDYNNVNDNVNINVNDNYLLKDKSYLNENSIKNFQIKKELTINKINSIDFACGTIHKKIEENEKSNNNKNFSTIITFNEIRERNNINNIYYSKEKNNNLFSSINNKSIEYDNNNNNNINFSKNKNKNLQENQAKFNGNFTTNNYNLNKDNEFFSPISNQNKNYLNKTNNNLMNNSKTIFNFSENPNSNLFNSKITNLNNNNSNNNYNKSNKYFSEKQLIKIHSDSQPKEKIIEKYKINNIKTFKENKELIKEKEKAKEIDYLILDKSNNITLPFEINLNNITLYKSYDYSKYKRSTSTEYPFILNNNNINNNLIKEKINKNIQQIKKSVNMNILDQEDEDNKYNNISNNRENNFYKNPKLIIKENMFRKFSSENKESINIFENKDSIRYKIEFNKKKSGDLFLVKRNLISNDKSENFLDTNIYNTIYKNFINKDSKGYSPNSKKTPSTKFEFSQFRNSRSNFKYEDNKNFIINKGGNPKKVNFP